MSYMTVIKSLKPETLGKRFELDADGQIKKSVVANVWRGEATAVAGFKPESLADLLRFACEQSNVALMSGRFVGANCKKPDKLATECKLADREERQ